MLMPKRVKRRKQFRGTMAGKALRGNKITNGEYGIVALEPAWIKSNQIEAARIAMTRYVKRNGKVWIKIFPDKPVTAKPAETRMGSGKGAAFSFTDHSKCTPSCGYLDIVSTISEDGVPGYPDTRLTPAANAPSAIAPFPITYSCM